MSKRAPEDGSPPGEHGAKRPALQQEKDFLRDLCKAGVTAKQLKKAGVSAIELKELYSTKELLRIHHYHTRAPDENVFSPSELLSCGFAAADLKDAGVTVHEMMRAGKGAKELFGLYPTKELSSCFAAKELCSLGLWPEELKQAGLSFSDIRTVGGFQVQQLRTTASLEAKKSFQLILLGTLPSSGAPNLIQIRSSVSYPIKYRVAMFVGAIEDEDSWLYSRKEIKMQLTLLNLKADGISDADLRSVSKYGYSESALTAGGMLGAGNIVPQSLL